MKTNVAIGIFWTIDEILWGEERILMLEYGYDYYGESGLVVYGLRVLKIIMFSGTFYVMT